MCLFFLNKNKHETQPEATFLAAETKRLTSPWNNPGDNWPSGNTNGLRTCPPQGIVVSWDHLPPTSLAITTAGDHSHGTTVDMFFLCACVPGVCFSVVFAFRRCPQRATAEACEGGETRGPEMAQDPWHGRKSGTLRSYQSTLVWGQTKPQGLCEAAHFCFPYPISAIHGSLDPRSASLVCRRNPPQVFPMVGRKRPCPAVPISSTAFMCPKPTAIPLMVSPTLL